MNVSGNAAAEKQRDMDKSEEVAAGLKPGKQSKKATKAAKQQELEMELARMREQLANISRQLAATEGTVRPSPPTSISEPKSSFSGLISAALSEPAALSEDFDLFGTAFLHFPGKTYHSF